MIEYQDKTILITGASSGIGESLAIKLDKLGANLILTARSKDKLDKLALKMNNATSNKPVEIIRSSILMRDCQY